MKMLGFVVSGACAALISFSSFAYETVQASASASLVASDKPSNILEAARQNGGFSIFLAAVEQSEMAAALSSPRMNYTLYAPTDAAFAKLGEVALAELLQDKEELRRVIAHHVVVGRYLSTDISAGVKQSIWGQSLPVTTHRNLHINWVKVVSTDLDSGNGVVHAVDNVILSAGDMESGFSQQVAVLNTSGLGQGDRF